MTLLLWVAVFGSLGWTGAAVHSVGQRLDQFQSDLVFRLDSVQRDLRLIRADLVRMGERLGARMDQVEGALGLPAYSPAADEDEDESGR